MAAGRFSAMYHYITGISTQGRSDQSQYVKRYTISFGDDEKQFFAYKVNENVKVRKTIYNLMNRLEKPNALMLLLRHSRYGLVRVETLGVQFKYFSAICMYIFNLTAT